MTDLARDLDDNLAATVTGSTMFTVDSMSSAAWAAQVVARNERRLREAEHVMNERIAAISEWFEAEKQRCDTSYLRELLVRYHRTVVDDELASGVPSGKVQKTIQLPDGVTLTRRPARGRVRVVDVDALPSDCVTWSPAAVNQNIRKRIDAGEDVPGVELDLPADTDDSGFTWSVRVREVGE